MVAKYGFDLNLLEQQDVQPLSRKYCKQLIIQKQIVTFNCFAKQFNSALKRPLKVKKAQSMMRGFY